MEYANRITVMPEEKRGDDWSTAGKAWYGTKVSLTSGCVQQGW